MDNRRRDSRNWTSVGIGVVTVATIMAAATAAGIFAAPPQWLADGPGPGQESYPEGFRMAAALLPVASLISYWGALFFGLIAAFRRTQASQKGEVLKAVILVWVQAGTAVSAVFLIIFARLF